MDNFSLFFSQFLNIFFYLWWLWLAILLYKPAKYFWLWGSRKVKFYMKINWILLEIKIPEEVEKTPKAMENVLSAMWALYDPPGNIRDFWISGVGIYFYSLEIVCKKGKIYFYIRTPKEAREVVEAAIYGEYPDAEIKETDDYVNDLGKKVPNEDYDLWGSDLALAKEDSYPVRTYEYWETELTREIKKIDPVSNIFELADSFKENEELWIQIRIAPITNEEHPYLEESKKLINRLMGRQEEKKSSLISPLHISKIPSDIKTVMIDGQPIPERGEEEEKPNQNARLSPGEIETIKSIEENLEKYVYEGNIRFAYIAKRDVFSVARGVGGVMGYFNQFATINLNGFLPDKNKTKVTPWFFESRRKYLKKRKLFRYYEKRMWPWFRKPYIFSTTELATIYHFPGKIVAPSPSAPRTEIKKGSAPFDLPEN